MDIIMVFGVWIFFILFAFLMLITVSVVISFFKKDKYEYYEPNVSIVIPCYNEEKNIAECLDSVYNLDYPKEKIEVIVVDDGSKDSTLNILESYKNKHQNLIILKGKHEGKSVSLNLGVKKSSYDFIMTVDSDTIIEKDSLKKLVRPFLDSNIGATNGSCVAKNSNSILAVFQRIEYHYNNLVRRSFSVLFKNGIWFFGAFACYRKSVLEKIGYFKTDTMTEDMDTAMEIYSAGYRTINVYDALGFTVVPHKLKPFFKQRMRWWIGALQTLKKNKSLFSMKSSPSIIFLFVSQYWWSFYAVISLFLIAYQVNYWLPYNTDSFVSLFMYLFRWFSLAGPVYVLYKIPVWGVSWYNIFGVLSGVISVALIIKSVYMFKDRLDIKNILGIFFYFPYTIILNTVIIVSLIKITFLNKSYFIY
jgi:cellulose synthase/poly-beta-1,6-N-acetylglucosamine synthase-like glycosyltransferase